MNPQWCKGGVWFLFRVHKWKEKSQLRSSALKVSLVVEEQKLCSLSYLSLCHRKFIPVTGRLGFSCVSVRMLLAYN